MRKGLKRSSATPKKVEEQKQTKNKTMTPGPVLVLSILVVIAAVSITTFFIVRNQSGDKNPWESEIKRRENPRNSLIFISELIEQYPSEEYLFCEQGRIQASIGEYEEAFKSLSSCWKASNKTNQESAAIKIVKTSRYIYLRQPEALTGESISNLLQETADTSNNLYGYFLAIQCLSQAFLWEGVETVARKSISLIEEKTSLGLQQMIFYQLITSLTELQKHPEALKVIRELISTENKNQKTWNSDLTLLEFQSKLLLRSSHKATQLQNAIHILEKRVNRIDAHYLPVNQRGTYASIMYALSELYRKSDEDQMANTISTELWRRFWQAEVLDNETWECYSDSSFHANYTEESVYVDYVTLPETGTVANQFHTNLGVFSDSVVMKSKKFEKPIHPQELFAYKLTNAKVQYSSYDRDMILVSTDCQLHGFANLIASRPPVGFSVLKKKNLVSVSKGILLHWKPLELHHWIVQCLPKLLFLIENDWLGDYESAVFLPFSVEIKEYLDLLLIEDERIIWMRRDRLYLADEAVVFDYRPINKKISLAQTFPPLSLLQSLRMSLIGTYLDIDALDVILVLRDQQKSTVNSERIVGELEGTLETLKETNERLANLQVIEIDPLGSVYHQLFAYKRARVIIGGDENLLANSAWMSPRATVINISPVPLQQTSTSILAAMLQLDYRIIPTTEANQLDKIAQELQNISNALFKLLAK